LGTIARRNDVEYIGDMSTWKNTHEQLKKKALEDYHFVEKLIDWSHTNGEKMNTRSTRYILKADLGELINLQLLKLYDKFREWQMQQYALGVALPILDFQSFSFVESNLNKYLKENVAPKHFQEYYSTFTEPVKNSFAQDQEEDLLVLMTKYYSSQKWRLDIKKKDTEYLKKHYPKFHFDLKKHTQKHCWVYYVYNGPEYIEQDFLEFIKDYLVRGIVPSQELKSKKARRNDLIKKQNRYIRELKPDKFNLAILKLAGKLIWGKPRRKDYQSKTYYHAKKLVAEIGKRLYLSPEQVKSTPYAMIKNGLTLNKTIDLDVVNQIQKFHVCLPNDNGTIATLFGKEAEMFSNKVKRAIHSKDVVHSKRIKGECACRGESEGIVKVVNVPADMHKMKYGDILVSTATTPSIVPAMKRASAIITDEGGLTCHAAIVSRELNIPCIIGTKIATQALKDGDEVKVSATRGIIKKI